MINIAIASIWCQWRLGSRFNKDVIYFFSSFLTTESDDSRPSTPSLSLQLYWINQDKFNPKTFTKLRLMMLCWSLGENNDDPGKKSRIELKFNFQKSKQRTRVKNPNLSCHLSKPMTPMNTPRLWWYDLIEVSRKIRKFWWTFGVSLATNDEEGQAIFETTVKKHFSGFTLSFWSLWSNDFHKCT